MEKLQGKDIPVPISSSPDSDRERDEFHPDSSPLRSPETSEIHPPTDQNQSAELTDDLRRKIIKQVEYYFSDENLPNDDFLKGYVSRNVEGFVPIGVIASFRKMKKLTKDVSIIAAALKESAIVGVSSNGKRVKRLHPLPSSEAKDPMVCTILVENLPEDHSLENLHRVFGEVGNIKNIVIRDPHGVKDGKKCTVAEKLISGKLHALVEYDAVEAAEKAVASLNNEQDWRYGLRVKLLKKVNKKGQKKKLWKDSEYEKANSIQTSEPSGSEENTNSCEQRESHDEEIVDGTSKEKNEVHFHKEKNGHKGRTQGPGRRHKHHGPSGYGHGIQVPSHGSEPSKPPPGPKMPDGTRGFTMGRGRSPTAS